MKINKVIDFKKLISEKISQEQIFRFYYPFKFNLNERCLSCFTTEKNPSMIIGTKSQSGDVIFKCFNSNHSGDSINFVMQLFNLDYFEALNKITEDFGLKDVSNTKYESIIKDLPKTKIIKTKLAPEIIVAERPFNKDELSYWNDYYQDIEDLKRERIYVPKKIWINKQSVYVNPLELTFCYYYPDLDKWKIYKPFSPKTKKWFTNVPFSYLEYIDIIDKSKNVLIAKAKKDKLLLQKALNYENIVVTQAEDLACFSSENINILKECKEVYTVFDNDYKGKIASWALTNNFSWKHCNVPDRLLKEGISDFADYGKKHGIEKIYNHFIKKNVI